MKVVLRMGCWECGEEIATVSRSVEVPLGPCAV
jgi:hypothetical protein